MKSNKKAQGLSLNTIIIAAIVLIVLIVLWAIFTGRMGGFTSEVAKCRGLDRIPKSECDKKGVVDPQIKYPEIPTDSHGQPSLPTDATDEPLVCCIPLG